MSVNVGKISKQEDGQLNQWWEEEIEKQTAMNPEILPVHVVTTTGQPIEDTEGFTPLTDDAYEYIINPSSIPGAQAPIDYIGPWMVIRIAQVLRRQLNLEETMSLVHPDGKIRECLLTKKGFQPVRYAYGIDIPNQSTTRKNEFADIQIEWGGQFYLNPNEATAVAVSGALWKYDPTRKVYLCDDESPLVILAKTYHERTGSFKLGVPLAQIQKQIEDRKNTMQVMGEAENFVSSTLLPRNRDLLSILESVRIKQDGSFIINHR